MIADDINDNIDIDNKIVVDALKSNISLQKQFNL